jgi:hypothetical protein
MMEADGVLLLGVEEEDAATVVGADDLGKRGRARLPPKLVCGCRKWFHSEGGWQTVSMIILCTLKNKDMVSCVLYAL